MTKVYQNKVRLKIYLPVIDEGCYRDRCATKQFSDINWRTVLSTLGFSCYSSQTIIYLVRNVGFWTKTLFVMTLVIFKFLLSKAYIPLKIPFFTAKHL